MPPQKHTIFERLWPSEVRLCNQSGRLLRGSAALLGEDLVSTGRKNLLFSGIMAGIIGGIEVRFPEWLSDGRVGTRCASMKDNRSSFQSNH